MVKNTRKTKCIYGLSAFLLAQSLCIAPTFAEDVNFRVNITEVLSVSLTTPDTWASGDINSATGTSDLLRNKINLKVTSNNGAGFTASMASKNTTNLVNTAKSTATIPTLASATTASAFPANYWGYSLNDTDAGSDSANYSSMDTNAITLRTESSATTYEQPIYFGAKANAAKESGTYANTVVISVVSGVIDDNDNPVTPVDPATPDDTTPNNPSYDGTNNRTVYTRTSTGTQTAPVATNTTTTTTEVSAGDNRDSYANAQGVTTTNIGEGTPLATGLAVTAAVAAATGTFFFILAKRKKDDDEDEEEQI